MVDLLNAPSIHWVDNEKPGWYQYRIERTLPQAYEWLDYYDKIVQWIYENVDMPYRHARWMIDAEHSRFRFRYERNYLQFLLRWS